jgi:hypothetical protein
VQFLSALSFLPASAARSKRQRVHSNWPTKIYGSKQVVIALHYPEICDFKIDEKF